MTATGRSGNRTSAFIDAALKADKEKSEARKITPFQAQERRRRDETRLYRIYTATNASRLRAREKLAGVDARLEMVYGENERQLRREVREQETMLEETRRTKRLWLKVTGQLEKKQQQIEGKKLTLQNIEMRKNEARGELVRVIEDRQKTAETLRERIETLRRPPEKKQKQVRQKEQPAPVRTTAPEPTPSPAPPRQPEPVNDNRPPAPAIDFDKAARMREELQAEYRQRIAEQNRQLAAAQQQSGPTRER